MRNVRDGGCGANARGFIKGGVVGRGNLDGKQVSGGTEFLPLVLSRFGKTLGKAFIRDKARL
jgi:hypothetical protein